MKKIFAWSYSALKDAETCPAKYKYRITKTPTEPNKYLVRGIAVHQRGEDYLNGKLRTVPKEYKLFDKQLRELKKLGASAESALAFDRDWRPTEWFGPQTWLRMKLDTHWIENDIIARFVDFKTGRPKDYPEQERIYAAAALCRYPEATRAIGQFWFLDEGLALPRQPAVYTRKNALPGIVAEFTLRARRLEKLKTFPTRPGGHCKFCDYSKRKGGPCRF